MNTELTNWAKTVLFAYKYLGSVCRSIDKRIKTMAVNSFHIGGIWNEGNSVYRVSEKIMKLSDIIKRVSVLKTVGDTDKDIKGIEIDSRQIQPGYIFVAMKGTQVDGHRFIP